MSDAPPSSAPGTQPDPGAPRQSRAGRLLALVRKLIDYGRELAASLQRDPAARPRHFDAIDIALILARITQGLQRAQALEERLLRNAARLDAPTRPRRASPQTRPRTAPPAAQCSDQADPPPAQLPTAEQIAAQVRRRPIGAVLADICRDFGILPSHPLWRELSELIIEHGGNLAALLKEIIAQAGRRVAEAWIAAGLPAGPVSPSQLPAGTGPP
jgi:hypothetical protein